MANPSRLRERMRKDIARLGSQKALAAAIGVSSPYISDVLAGNREPGRSILKHYGLTEQTIYVPTEKSA